MESRSKDQSWMLLLVYYLYHYQRFLKQLFKKRLLLLAFNYNWTQRRTLGCRRYFVG